MIWITHPNEDPRMKQDSCFSASMHQGYRNPSVTLFEMFVVITFLGADGKITTAILHPVSTPADANTPHGVAITPQTIDDTSLARLL